MMMMMEEVVDERGTSSACELAHRGLLQKFSHLECLDKYHNFSGRAANSASTSAGT